MKRDCGNGLFSDVEVMLLRHYHRCSLLTALQLCVRSRVWEGHPLVQCQKHQLQTFFPEYFSMVDEHHTGKN